MINSITFVIPYNCGWIISCSHVFIDSMNIRQSNKETHVRQDSVTCSSPEHVPYHIVVRTHDTSKDLK